jgi:hypothetical protein
MSRISNWFTYKKTAWIMGILFFLSMLPILYCSFFDYATGDDLIHGAIVHNAIKNGIPFFEMMGEIFYRIHAIYYSFQGNWATLFACCFEPSVFGERMYFITPLIAIISLCGGTAYLLYEFLVHWCGMRKQVYFILFCITDFFLIQYMITPRAGIYWYSGMMHYTFPFGLALYSTAWVLKFLSSGKKRYLIYTIIGMTYIGGAGYPAVVLSIVLLFLFLISGLFNPVLEEKKKILYLFIPLVLLLAGFAVSALAPGNKIRGGSDFGFSSSRALSALINSILAGFHYDLSYLYNVRPMFLMILAEIVVELDQIDIQRSKLHFSHPVTAVIISFLVTCSVHAPELYAGDDVQAGISGGVYNSYYFVFVIAVFFTVFYLCGWIKTKNPNVECIAQKIRFPFVIFTLLFCLVLGKHLVGNTVDFTCMEFISSGQLSDFESQMQERLAILNTDDKNVVVPEMNNEQGPFMHMALMRDPAEYTNRATEAFYDKDTVIAIPRDEYNKKIKAEQ